MVNELFSNVTQLKRNQIVDGYFLSMQTCQCFMVLAFTLAAENSAASAIVGRVYVLVLIVL
jgi:hypothetical protein